MINSTIVVSTYNRLDSLKRLLNSLINANYDGFENVRLIISVDKHPIEEKYILKYLNEFSWPYGELIIKNYTTRLGLKNHFITCCDFCLEYESIIFLEDDFIVSPSFYLYANQISKFYFFDDRIAGICLYDLGYSEFANRLFSPILDCNDQYFMQLISWGKVFTKNKWKDFKRWYDTDYQNLNINLPKVVSGWSDRSFKKEYIKYLISENKFIVFPRKSFVTNYGDPGEHFSRSDTKFQRSIRLDRLLKKNLIFPTLDDSYAVYDAYMEILPEKLKQLNPELLFYDFTVDLYGIKNKDNIDTKYILTAKRVTQRICSFGRLTKPHETNIVFKNKGDYFSLAETSKIIKRRKGFKSYFNDCLYDDSGLSAFKLLFIDIMKSVLNMKQFMKRIKS